MQNFRVRQKLAIWFALWSFLLGLFMPVAGYAFVDATPPGPQQGQWLELCTGHGIEVVQVQGASHPDEAKLVHDAPHFMAAGHCLYCSLSDEQIAVGALALDGGIKVWLTDGDGLHRWEQSAQLLPAEVWRDTCGQPRAPPLL